MKTGILIAGLILGLGYTSIQLAQARHANEDAYWQGWHEGKAAQFEADSRADVDGEGR